MIVVDDFLDKDLIKTLQDLAVWDHVIDNYSWYQYSKEPSNIWEQIIAIAVTNLNLPEPLGFEYWCNKLSENQFLPWHQDKDERAAGLKQEIIPSEYSCVYYGYSSEFWGGMLEIPVEDTKAEVERIAPRFNRLVVMPKHLEHRVTRVWKGHRLAFSFGAWTTKPWLFEESDIVESNKVREWVYGA